MPAKGRSRCKPDFTRVRVARPAELRAWAKYWGCTQQNIRDAVNICGVMEMDVQDWLRVNVVR